MKPVSFLGTSLADLRAFPDDARRDAGHQLSRVQSGLEPDDWKPMAAIGVGVKEIRVRERTGIFRVIYLAARQEAVYVLHAFQKKTNVTAKRDLAVAEARFRALIGHKL